jgi:cob(I)alamin adenosyltransferase
VKIYTRDGDDGSTGLYFGGRVAKSSDQIEVNGAVDEAQATFGWARSQSEAGGQINELLIVIERDLWVLMAEVATLPANRHKLTAGKSLVTAEMITHVEEQIDALSNEIEMPKESSWCPERMYCRLRSTSRAPSCDVPSALPLATRWRTRWWSPISTD